MSNSRPSGRMPEAADSAKLPDASASRSISRRWKPHGQNVSADELKLEEILEESVLRLEVLRTEQNALRPQHGLHLPHERRS